MKKYTLLLLIVTLFFQSSYAAKMSAKKAYLYGKMYTQFIAPQAIRNLHSLLGAIFEQKDFSDKKMTPREEQIQWAANDLMCQCAKPTKENYQ